MQYRGDLLDYESGNGRFVGKPEVIWFFPVCSLSRHITGGGEHLVRPLHHVAAA
jgi:hypothetical protein